VRRELSDFAPLYFWKIFKSFRFYFKDKKVAKEEDNQFLGKSKQEKIDHFMDVFDEWV